MNIVQQVADFVTRTRWEDLPQPAQRQARMCLLDSLGATLAGTLAPVSRIAADCAAELWPGDDATILLHGRRAGAVGAAFANGCAANGLDIDDCGLYTKGHPGAQIFPTALAVAEQLGLDGARMLAAMVVGYEVAIRTARCWHDRHPIYQACGSWGSVACAAVAANLMGLTPGQTCHALGIAEYHAPNLPMMHDVDHPAMVKHGIGWGAATGIIAAVLAAHGYTGTPSILGEERYRDWVADIGRQYLMVGGVAWKPYACCAWAHAALNGARRLVREHAIPVEEIAHIRLETFHEAVRLGTALPTTTEEAQFSMAWPLAVFLLDGEVGPAQMLEPRLEDEHVRELAARVELAESERLNDLARRLVAGDPQGKLATVVTITLKDGRAFRSGEVESGIRYPPPDWDEARLEAKFRWLVGHVLDRERVEALLDLTSRFERLSDVRELTRMVGVRCQALVEP